MASHEKNYFKIEAHKTIGIRLLSIHFIEINENCYSEILTSFLFKRYVFLIFNFRRNNLNDHRVCDDNSGLLLKTSNRDKIINEFVVHYFIVCYPYHQI